jgi:hypothetical protein
MKNLTANKCIVVCFIGADEFDWSKRYYRLGTVGCKHEYIGAINLLLLERITNSMDKSP